MASAQTMEIPSSFSYSDTDTDAKAAFPSLKATTTFQLAVTGADRGIGRDGNYQLIVDESPIGADNKPVPGVSVRTFVDIPVLATGTQLKTKVWDGDVRAMVEVTGTKAKNALFKKAKGFVLGYDPAKVPAFGFRKEDGSEIWRDAEGNEATQAQMDAATKAQRDAVLATLKEWYETPAKLINAMTYGTTGNVSSGGKTYINRRSAELPEGATVETETFVQ